MKCGIGLEIKGLDQPLLVLSDVPISRKGLCSSHTIKLIYMWYGIWIKQIIFYKYGT